MTDKSRIFYLAVAVICAGLLGFGYYLQFGKGLEPCPLCIFQRVAYMAIFAVALAAAFLARSVRWGLFFDGLITIGAAAGAAIAGRQVWLQHLPPDRVPECGPGLDYLLEVFPLTETVRLVFSGSGECAEVDWTFLALSIAEWSLVFLAALVAATLWHGVKVGRR